MQCDPIGYIRTPYSQKFGIPRQPALAQAVEGTIHFSGQYNNSDFIRGIEQFSHLWLVFVFHQHAERTASPLVRPPRLGGNQKVGVFASRSSFRPNPLGLSLVTYRHHQVNDGKLELTVAGVDLLDNTPVLDIKPYIPYADSIPNAHAGYADDVPRSSLMLSYSGSAERQLQAFESQYPTLGTLIEVSIGQDPRPAYKANQRDDKRYTLRLFDIDIHWHVTNDTATITSLNRIEPDEPLE